MLLLEDFSAVVGLPEKSEGHTEQTASAAILVYHRFGPIATDAMTVRTSVFASQMKFLHENGYTVVPLRNIVAFVAGRGQLPSHAVAITVDDGHSTIFTEMKPIVQSYRIPVTLFIYPSQFPMPHMP